MSRASELCQNFGLSLTYSANRQEIEAFYITVRAEALKEAAEVCRDLKPSTEIDEDGLVTIVPTGETYAAAVLALAETKP